MTREQIIEQLDSIVGTYEILYGNGVNSDILESDDIEAIREAISALSDYDKMQKISLDLAFENDELMNKSRWIPVSERLPEEEYEVYCQLSDGSNAVLYVQDNWGQMEWVDGMMGTGTYDVVAWREKPEPYKAEKGGE